MGSETSCACKCNDSKDGKDEEPQGLMQEKGLPSYLLSYLSCSIEEQRRVMQACPLSPMHFTGSREIAAKIKEVNPRLIASTGGPNTLVSTECTSKEIQNVVQMSNLIENKGQCTALRQWVCLSKGDDAKRSKISRETLEGMYGEMSQYKADALESVETGAFAGILRCAQNTNGDAQGKYSTLAARPEVHFKINDNELPVDIQEYWRRVHIDCTNLEEAKVGELIAWLNNEQPITLAVNDDGWDLKHKFFESTGLVVYTFGTKEKGYGLTAQARPQDGEIFGEFPPRKGFEAISRYPMLNPLPCSAWNTVLTAEHLLGYAEKGSGAPAAAKSIVGAIEDPKYKGYANLLVEYLTDSCASNPYTVSKETGTGRTAYFGLQRPPIVEDYFTLINYGGAETKDLFLLHLLPFAITNSRDQCVVSLENGGDSLKDLVSSTLGIKVVDPKAPLNLFNDVRVDQAAKQFEFCLPFLFCAKLFCLGHCKSTVPNDDEFLKEFATSKKWLKLRP
mmetsp:Transcript_77244/g.218439  ORF Transcript_77244/g.218439 Transcript_77244/m.218439 type:complete len:506 (+) Transcript_77244:99-1616(+)